jgi:hypothetical protein
MSLLKKKMRIEDKKNKFVEKLNLGLLDDLSKEFLNSCGRVRDVDVLIETIRYSGLHDADLKIKLQTQRTEKIAQLSRKWTTFKRQKLIRNSKKLIDFLAKKRPIRKKMVIKTGKQIIKKLVSKYPGTKLEWHEFRRKLRKANYLLDLAGESNKNLLRFQKFLGIVQDLENLRKIERKKLKTAQKRSSATKSY